MLTFANVVQPLKNMVRRLDTLYLLSGCWCSAACVTPHRLLLDLFASHICTSQTISSVPCVCFSSFTSVIHCSFRLRHFLKKLQKSLLVSTYRSAGPSICLPVCPSVRIYRLDSQPTEIREILCWCISLTFVARFKFYSNRTNRTDTVREDIHLWRYKCWKCFL
jgi:hypothetical protein